MESYADFMQAPYFYRAHNVAVQLTMKRRATRGYRIVLSDRQAHPRMHDSGHGPNWRKQNYGAWLTTTY